MKLGTGIKSVALEATIIRADGTEEPQGIVAYSHRNPLKQMLVRLRSPRLRVFGRIGKVRT
jgi:hypothetical protein